MKLLKNKYEEKVTNFIILLPFVWVFTGLLAYDHGKTEFISFLLLSILTVLITFKYKKLNFQLNNNFLGKILILVSVCYGLLGFVTDIRFSFVKICLLLGFFFLVIPKKNVHFFQKKIPIFIFIGSIFSLLFVLYNVYYLQNGRGNWNPNSITYSTVIASFFISSLYFFLKSHDIKNKILMILSLFITIPGLMLGGSRGVWLALLSSIILFLIINRNTILKYKLIYISFFIVIGLICSQFTTQINQRIDASRGEINLIENGNTNTSFGYRLEMWKAGFYILPQAPFFGVGNEHIEYKQKLADEGLINSNVVPFYHYHNQYIDLLVKNGVVGFTLIMILFFYPAYMYLLRKNKNYELPFLIFVIYAISALTETPLNRPITLIFYFVLIFITTNNLVNKENNG